MGEAYLESVDWVKYLERDMDLFLFASFSSPYSTQLKKITGFGFTYRVVYFKEGRGIFYDSGNSLAEADEYFRDLIVAEDEKIGGWLSVEKEIREKGLELIRSVENGDSVELSSLELLDFFEQLLIYNTVIPYRIFSAFKLIKEEEWGAYTVLRDRLEDARNHSLYPTFYGTLIKPLLKKVGRGLSLSEELSVLLTPEEVRGFLSGEGGLVGVTSEVLEKRNAGCYFYVENGKNVFYFGTISGILQEGIPGGDEIKGKVAYPGFASGKVCIVNRPDQMEQFEEGDVLFSINTNPSILPVIEKASAIVTDEGGMLCHAAIVSRELKKPCVIGTHYATRMFTNGEFVEVDAETGVVRRKK